MRIYIAILTSGVVGVLIGFTAAYSLSNDEFLASEFSTTLPDSITTSDHNTVVTFPALDKNTQLLDSDLRVHTIHDISKLESNFDQDLSLLLLLSRADVEELEEYIGQIDEFPSTNQQIAVLSVIFGRYAAIDPQRAIDRVLELDELTEKGKEEIVSSIFDEWTLTNLDAAVAALHELPQAIKEIGLSAMMWRIDHLSPDQRIELAQALGPRDDWIDYTIRSIRSELIYDNPRATYFDLLRDPSSINERTVELAEIGEQLVAAEGVAALREIYDSLESPNGRHNVLSGVIRRTIREEIASPSSVLHVVSALPRAQEARNATETVLRSWTYLDPKAAFDAALELDDRSVSDRSRRELLFTWASRDAASLYDEALSFPRKFQNDAITRALAQISRESPQKAIRLAQDLDSLEHRTSARGAIVFGWSHNDAKAAFEWLTNDALDIGEQADKSLWRNTFSSYLGQDYPNARAYVDQYEGELRDQLVEATADHLLNSDIDSAIDYIKSVDLEISEALLRNIAYSLAEYNGIKALGFGESIAQNQQDTYYQNLVEIWVYHDFVGLFENIHRVPPKYQSLAVTRLLNINAQDHYLSDREVEKLESLISSE